MYGATIDTSGSSARLQIQLKLSNNLKIVCEFFRDEKCRGTIIQKKKEEGGGEGLGDARVFKQRWRTCSRASVRLEFVVQVPSTHDRAEQPNLFLALLINCIIKLNESFCISCL